MVEICFLNKIKKQSMGKKIIIIIINEKEGRTFGSCDTKKRILLEQTLVSKKPFLYCKRYHNYNALFKFCFLLFLGLYQYFSF